MAARKAKAPKSKTSADDKREAILQAALTLFVERGFHGTAVPQIAAQAGVAAGTIYHHFANKEALGNALFRRWKEAIAGKVLSSFPQEGDARQQFSAVWKAMVTFAQENEAAFGFIELHHHSSYLDEQSRAVDHQLKAFGAGFVGRWQKEGVLKPMNPLLLMELVFGSFISMMRAHGEERVTLDADLLQAAEDACWDMIRVHGP